ncbi:MAG TPA: hypothetical protein VM582_00650, partial [Candidatus Thermoplasmatota archaeon]|nr:hypothetical protein [Candidatus Thermoplasmatota archaeon]
MTARTPVVLALVLMALAAPTAVALGEEVRAAAAEATSLADATHAAARSLVESLAPREPRQEEAARQHEEAQHPPPKEEAPQREREPREAPPQPRSSTQPLLGSVRGLVPVPLADAGAAPRIDLSALAAAVPLAPLAPAPAAQGAPVAPANAAAAAPAREAGPAAEPLGPVPLALAATAAASAAAPAAAGALWERLRRVAWLGLLYSRIAKERLLDHASRERLLDAIRAQPGAAVADLAAR